MDAEITPEKKLIFSYMDGNGNRIYADPLVIRGKLACKAMELYQKELNDLIRAGNPAIAGGSKFDALTPVQKIEAWNAMAALDELSRIVFELPPFSKQTGEGADMDHALGVLANYHKWCEKKNPKPLSRSTFTPSAESISEPQPTTGTSSV